MNTSAFAGSTYEQERQQRAAQERSKADAFAAFIRCGAGAWNVISLADYAQNGNTHAVVESSESGVRVSVWLSGDKVECSMAALTQSGKTYHASDYAGYCNGMKLGTPRASFTWGTDEKTQRRIYKGIFSRVANTPEARTVSEAMHSAANSADHYLSQSEATTCQARDAMELVGFKDGDTMRVYMPGPQRNGRDDRDGRITTINGGSSIDIEVHGARIALKLDGLTSDDLRKVLRALKS